MALETPDLTDEEARKILEPTALDIGDAVEYGEFLIRKTRHSVNDETGEITAAQYEVYDDERGELTGLHIDTRDYAVDSYDELRDTLEDAYREVRGGEEWTTMAIE